MARWPRRGHITQMIKIEKLGQIPYEEGLALMHGNEAAQIEAIRIFAPLAAVAPAAQTVHGDGLGFVGLLADRPVGHGAGLEAFDDLGSGLDLVERRGLDAVG